MALTCLGRRRRRNACVGVPRPTDHCPHQFAWPRFLFSASFSILYFSTPLSTEWHRLVRCPSKVPIARAEHLSIFRMSCVVLRFLLSRVLWVTLLLHVTFVGDVVLTFSFLFISECKPCSETELITQFCMADFRKFYYYY